jgi:hypothetical protein
MSTEDEAGSFAWTCHHLALDPEAVRMAYLRGLPLSLGLSPTQKEIVSYTSI